MLLSTIHSLVDKNYRDAVSARDVIDVFILGEKKSEYFELLLTELEATKTLSRDIDTFKKVILGVEVAEALKDRNKAEEATRLFKDLMKQYQNKVTQLLELKGMEKSPQLQEYYGFFSNGSSIADQRTARVAKIETTIVGPEEKMHTMLRLLGVWNRYFDDRGSRPSFDSIDELSS